MATLKICSRSDGPSIVAVIPMIIGGLFCLIETPVPADHLQAATSEKATGLTCRVSGRLHNDVD